MSTAETVKAQLQADIMAANGVTGKQDSTVHDAIASLIAGFGDGNVVVASPIFKDLGSNVWTLASDHTRGTKSISFSLPLVADFCSTHNNYGIVVAHTKYIDENIGGDWFTDGVNIGLMNRLNKPTFMTSYLGREMNGDVGCNTSYGFGYSIDTDGTVYVYLNAYSTDYNKFKAGSYKTTIYGIEV